MQAEPGGHYAGVPRIPERLGQIWRWLPVRLRCWLGRVFAAVFIGLSPLVAYFLTALFLGSITVNSGRVEPAEGVVLFIDARGPHTDLFLPLRTTTMDFSRWFRREHFMRFNPYGDYVCVGWGDRAFYEQVWDWTDLTPGIALRSTLLPTPTVAHVSLWRRRQLEREGFQRIVLSDEEFARLCEGVQGGFRTGRDGLPVVIPHFTHRGWDAFYAGAGSYDGIDTCNQWAGAALRRAGARMGLWTPLAWQIREGLGNSSGE